VARRLVTPLRWSWFVVPFGICLGTLGSSSCIQIGPDAKDGSAGADAGEPTNSTVEDQCTRIVTAFCARTQECYGQDPETCVGPGVDQCCGRACAKQATSSERAVDTCVADINAGDCEEIDAVTDASDLPASCQNVVKY
jgi:hypothetical protein